MHDFAPHARMWSNVGNASVEWIQTLLSRPYRLFDVTPLGHELRKAPARVATHRTQHGITTGQRIDDLRVLVTV
jgi:hypothetical protein